MYDPTDEVIEEILEGKPRAAELAEMVEALEVRRETFLRERNAAPSDAHRKEWERKIREVEKQLQLLREETAITEFVEKSVRATMNRPRRPVEFDEYE